MPRATRLSRESREFFRRLGELEFFSSRESFHEELETKRHALMVTALGREHPEWATASRVAGTLTLVVLADAGAEIAGYPAIQGVVGTEREVDGPGPWTHGPGRRAIGCRSTHQRSAISTNAARITGS